MRNIHLCTNQANVIMSIEFDSVIQWYLKINSCVCNQIPEVVKANSRKHVIHPHWSSVSFILVRNCSKVKRKYSSSMVASLPYSRNYLQESLTDGLCSSPLPRFRRRRGGSRPAWAPSLQSSSPCGWLPNSTYLYLDFYYTKKKHLCLLYQGNLLLTL